MENYNIIETLVAIYSAGDGKLKIFLQRKKEDPYKGYWVLPKKVLSKEETLDESARTIYKNAVNINAEKIMQSYAFSEIKEEPRVISQTYIAITDERTALIKSKETENEMAWFDMEELPKMGYNQEEIVKKVTEEVKVQIINNYNDIIMDFFPNDFTLPELQKFCETVYNKKIDRRNFHKKFVSQKLVIDTGIKTAGGSGRPGALYRFNKENMKGKKI